MGLPSTRLNQSAWLHSLYGCPVTDVTLDPKRLPLKLISEGHTQISFKGPDEHSGVACKKGEMLKLS